MITLAASLLAHQRGNDRLPYLYALARNQRAGAHLLRWATLHVGPESDSPHASTIAADGSLVRARNDAGTVYTARTTAPGAGSDFATWASTATALAGSGVALAASSAETILLYTRGTTLYYRTSADNGATWSVEATARAEGVAIGFVAVRYRPSSSDLCAFYSVGATLKRLRRTAGVWDATGTAWTNAAASVTGVSATHDGSDFVLLVTGTALTTAHRRVWACQMGDGGLPANAWSALVNVAEADANSTTTFAGPASLALGSQVHGAYAHKEAGNVPSNRAFASHPPAGDVPTQVWSEPQPLDATGQNGLAFAYAGSGNTVFATSHNAVYVATVNQSLDLSARVLAARYSVTPTSARASLVLDNADGGLAAHDALNPGCTVELRPGYRSGAGATPEYGASVILTIDEIRRTVARGRATLTIEASGPWEQVAHWHAPQAWQTAAGALSRANVFARLAARAGFPAYAAGAPYGPSSDWTGYNPSFALPQGESAREALTRLLAVVNDGVRADSSSFTVTGLADPQWAAQLAALSPVVWLRLTDPAGAALARDHSGAGKNATPTAVSFAAAGPLVGQPTGAADFNGATSRLATGLAAFTATTNFTLLALVRPGVLPQRGIAACNGQGSATGGGVSLCVGNGAGGSGSKLELLINAVANVDTGYTFPAANAWYFVAVTRDATTLRCYVNGVQTPNSSLTAPLAATAQFSVGAKQQNTGGTWDTFFTGQVAEVAAFTSCLSATQLADLNRALNPSQYDYGPTAHPVTSLTTVEEPPPFNWVRLQGLNRYADAQDAASLALHGARLKPLRNLDASTNGRATSWAQGALRRQLWNQPRGELRAAVNAGQQLFDLVTVQSAANGLTAPTLFRVLGLALDYQAGGAYDHVITLGAP